MYELKYLVDFLHTVEKISFSEAFDKKFKPFRRYHVLMLRLVSELTGDSFNQKLQDIYFECELSNQLKCK